MNFRYAVGHFEPPTAQKLYSAPPGNTASPPLLSLKLDPPKRSGAPGPSHLGTRERTNFPSRLSAPNSRTFVILTILGAKKNAKTREIRRFWPSMPTGAAPFTEISPSPARCFPHTLKNLANPPTHSRSKSPKTRASNRCTVSVQRIFGTEIEGHKYATSAHLRLGNHPAIQARI